MVYWSAIVPSLRLLRLRYERGFSIWQGLDMRGRLGTGADSAVAICTEGRCPCG